jgi:hypothetical protein
VTELKHMTSTPYDHCGEQRRVQFKRIFMHPFTGWEIEKIEAERNDQWIDITEEVCLIDE